jgi:hypothetical protein
LGEGVGIIFVLTGSNIHAMKNLYLLLLAALPVASLAQKAQMGAYLATDIPVKSVMPNMSTNFGFGLQFAYKPVEALPMLLELKGNMGQYSNRTLQQTFVFSDDSQTTTNVTYTSAMNRIGLGTKFYIGHEYRSIRGFVTPQIGMSFLRSRIVIADPADADDCRPLDRKTTQRDAGIYYGGEAGLEVGFDRLFKNSAEGSKNRLYLSVSYLGSWKTYDYVNVKHMKDHDHEAMGHGESSDRDVTAGFVNVSTNNIHEHKVAELYRTQLKFVGINVGYVFYF